MPNYGAVILCMPDFLKHTFLYRVFQADKKLFALFSLYILGVLYGVRYSREEFPFMLYGMYSLPETNQQEYVTYRIEVDGRAVPFTTMWDSQKELFTSPLTSYDSLTENYRAQFQPWLLRYASANAGKKLRVYRLTCRYNANGVPQIISQTELFNYAAE